MLESLNTLIAISVIMSIASLLVTVIVHTVSGALSVRGDHLAQGVIQSIQAVSPASTAEATHLAHQLLTKKGLMADTKLGTFFQKLDLWPWLKRLLSGVTLAGVARPEEIYAALKQLASASPEEINGKQAQLDAMPAIIANAEAAVSVARDEVDKLKVVVMPTPDLDQQRADADKTLAQNQQTLTSLKSIQLRLTAEIPMLTLFAQEPGPLASTMQRSSSSTAAAALLSALMPDEQKVNAVRDAFSPVIEQLRTSVLTSDQRKAFDDAIQKSSQTLISEADTLKASVEKWFNSAVDQAQEWFQSYSKMVTVIVGFALCIVFQWDAVEIYKQVSAPNSQLRDSLVAEAADVLKEADGILPPQDANGETSSSDGLLESINKEWAKDHKDGSDFPALTSLSGIKNTSQLKARLLNNPKATSEAKATAGNAFDTIVSKEITAYTKDKAESIKKLTSMTSFQLIPDNGWRWKLANDKDAALAEINPVQKFFVYWCQNYHHIPGIIIFAGLLSLGAPFWYNLLKNLTGMTPALSKILQKEDPAKNAAQAG